MTIRQTATTNKLLNGLTTTDFALLSPHLQQRNFALKEYLERASQPISCAVFLDSAIASTVASSPAGEDVEVGLSGLEGMTGTALVLQGETAPLDIYIRCAGFGYALPACVLVAALKQSRTLETRLLSYVQTMIVQAASTALVNGVADAETRLARWLLMLHDRSAGSNISVTHKFMAVMLAMHRPWVTETLHVLEGKRLIRSTRGNVHILDRAGLIAAAKGFYGMAEKEYERIMARANAGLTCGS
ncbi:Crp/Fnr family transcriptional regulator [Phyllobacterium endophyticum]|uniref:Cyclic nucleotide-binding protein n=1 Tax=Phyllobacterium endophyticum TaxID=1149773 RepID=A0A2P7AUR9_9HYPH|nr:Crp/Fnr family transcriptional regulator [Phyllobacterium endophyticum]MBB3234463.1 CRP-like cAMP-binding protein [Phyllobacterium endophyticum]PSH57969.1 cyclic nucleotide-binding protein [Phyllobacterium endophyticum]TYR44176.1 Crp/Fnr family transcriptional regulator [Phyllobacterium endophyticum]